MTYKISKYLLGASLLFCTSQAFAQTYHTEEPQQNESQKYKRAWEFGVGGSALHMTRMSVLDFTNKTANGGYGIDVNKRDVLFGGNIYLARQLSRYFFLDLQGTVGYAQDPIKGGKEDRFLYMGGIGLQWRLGEYFESKYIDPFFRVGGNYMYKTFNQFYNGTEQFNGTQMAWNFDLDHNKSGADLKQLFPVAFGTGVNMWMSDKVGIGLQADYLYMPHANVANIWQGTARLIFRFCGESKRPKPEYRTVEKIVERERIVEKHIPAPIVEVPESNLCELFNYVYFEFDKSDITAESLPIVDQIADILKQDLTRKYLIIGYTDSRGSERYNIGLSERRAKALVDALLERGIPKDMLKSRGVGKKISYVAPSAPDNTRRGDRKVTIERVINMDYWEYLK